MQPRAPSGLFPSANPPRPTYREPHPVRAWGVFSGIGGGVLWQLLLGLLAMSLRSYLWITIAASVVAWLAALALARFGDRGVAVGIALATSVGLSIAVIVLVSQWFSTGWPLW